ncbi:hypothetical protein OIV83_006193 [Microbotryomycetes sp. JL201]|nr:hypothetical protein OIV83_006193 [Microbotryomycetes sp. JL201]
MSLSKALTRLSLSPKSSTSQARRLVHATARHAQAPAVAAEYPFSSKVIIVPAPPSPPPAKLGDSLLRSLNAHLTSLHPRAEQFSTWFSRRSKDRILPGSVLTVTTYSSAPITASPSPSTSQFSGVLIGVRRRHMGRDTSIRLRNLVGRTGVEINYKVFSPLIKDITVVARAVKSGPPIVDKSGKEIGRRKPVLRAARRAKMYFVRDQPSRLVGVAGLVKQAREREQQLTRTKR